MNQILREIGLNKQGENSSSDSDCEETSAIYDGSQPTGKCPKAANFNSYLFIQKINFDFLAR